MGSVQQVAFDELAADYDNLWSNSAVGMSQRLGVWRWVDPLFRQGDFVLDLGCGTGLDALHLQARGVDVYGIDASPRMVSVARARGVDAHCARLERLNRVPPRFDGALSNFAALNCVDSLTRVASSLGRLIRPGGHLALCVFNTFCCWEMIYYLSIGKWTRAFRRFNAPAEASCGVQVTYFSKSCILRAFEADFRLLRHCGIGLTVPPSYVRSLGSRTVSLLSSIDKRVAHYPFLRALSDHSLYIFKHV